MNKKYTWTIIPATIAAALCGSGAPPAAAHSYRDLTPHSQTRDFDAWICANNQCSPDPQKCGYCLGGGGTVNVSVTASATSTIDDSATLDITASKIAYKWATLESGFKSTSTNHWEETESIQTVNQVTLKAGQCSQAASRVIRTTDEWHENIYTTKVGHNVLVSTECPPGNHEHYLRVKVKKQLSYNVTVVDCKWKSCFTSDPQLAVINENKPAEGKCFQLDGVTACPPGKC